MKQIYFVAILLAIHAVTFAQLNNGGLNASFGVDADTKAGYIKYGPTTGTISSDDWFSSSTALGKNVIDTTNAAYYKSLLQAGNNISFSKRMSTSYFSTINGKLWLDALYSRDYIVNTVSTDTTTFTGGKKNYTSGVPTVEVRIWVSKTTYNTVAPALFTFGSSFDGSTTSFGYASILQKQAPPLSVADLPTNSIKDRFQVVAVYIENQLRFSGKIIY